MQYGAMNFPVLPIVDEIETFANLGFDYLELAMDPPMAHHSIIASQRKEIDKTLQENGMGLVCHLPTFVTTADLTESLRKASVWEMQQSLQVAHSLGARKVVLHPSMVGGMGGLVLDSVKKYAFDFFADIVSAAEEMDITICLENMFPRNVLGVEPEDFMEIFNIFPKMKMTLDTGHANIDDWSGNRLLLLVEQFGRQIGHLHFSDNNGRRDEHLAIGEGIIKFKKLIRKLKTVGYDETLTLEVFDNNRQELVKSRKRIEKLFSD